MKHTAIFFLIVLMLASIFGGCKREDTVKDSYSGNVVNVYSTPEMYEVATILVKEFSKFNPEVDIKVNQESRSAVLSKLTEGSNLALVSGELPKEYNDQNLWKEVIGRDIIVPVFNASNPYSDQLLVKGITQSDLEDLLTGEEPAYWSKLIKSPEGKAISLCIADDPAVLSGIKKFTGLQELKSGKTALYGSEDLINSVTSDPYALGLCRLRSLFADGSGEIPVTLKILPIDKNNNGRVDYVENIYNDYESISRGVWIGKYPRELINNIYSLTAQKPYGENELAFLKWVITDGQQHLGNYGYNNLVHNERLAKLSLLEGLEINIEDNVSYAKVRNPLSFYIYFPLILTAGIIILFVIFFVLKREKEKLTPITENLYASGTVFNEDSIRSPEGFYYDRTHTWAYMEEDGMVKIGIDDFLQHITGPLTRVKLKSTGERVKKGKHIL